MFIKMLRNKLTQAIKAVRIEAEDILSESFDRILDEKFPLYDYDEVGESHLDLNLDDSTEEEAMIDTSEFDPRGEIFVVGDAPPVIETRQSLLYRLRKEVETNKFHPEDKECYARLKDISYTVLLISQVDKTPPSSRN